MDEQRTSIAQALPHRLHLWAGVESAHTSHMCVPAQDADPQVVPLRKALQQVDELQALVCGAGGGGRWGGGG